MRLLPALLLLLVPLLTSGCATLGALPSAQFAGMTVETIQDSPGDPNLKLNLGLDFRVKNPLDIKLVVPKHSFGLNVDGAPAAESGVKNEFQVGAKSARTVRYDFVLDLSERGVGRAFGKDATFGFSADVNIDVPQKVLEILEDQLPDLGGVTGDAGELLSSSLTALSSSSSGSATQAKLSFEHQGRLKLARIPRIKARAGNPQPAVALVGQSETMNVANLLGNLGADIGPLAEFFEQFENARVNQQVDLPVGDMLELIGVPANLTSTVLTAINGVLSLNGKAAISSRNNTVSVPVQLPALPDLLSTLDPQASSKIRSFTSGWADFQSNSGALASLAIPTALPEGVRVALPFALDNPNEFSIVAPSFRIALMDADGRPIALVQVQRPDQSGERMSTVQDRRVTVGAESEASLELVSEFHWDRLGTTLLEMAANPGATPNLNGLQIVGDVTIDPGYGPITLPIRVPLPNPSAGGDSNPGGSSSGGSSSGGSKPASGGSAKKSTSPSEKDAEPAPTQSGRKKK